MSCLSPDHLVLVKFKTQEEIYKCRTYEQYNYWSTILSELYIIGKYRFIKISDLSKFGLSYTKLGSDNKIFIPNFLYNIEPAHASTFNSNNCQNLKYILL